MSELKEKIKATLLEALENDTLVLPTLPEVALNVREITQNEDSGINDLINVINQDAALSARLLKVSNSPLFRGANEIKNLNMAVGRLGMEYTSSLAMGLAMEQMFQATTEMVDQRMRQAWERSTEIAGVANVLARQSNSLNPGQAALAGLVHVIGILPILKYVEDEGIQINSVILDNLLEELHPILGEKILEKWDFPAELRAVPRGCIQFTRQVANADYADLVMVSILQTLSGTDHPYTQMNWEAISAFKRLGIDPNASDDDEDLSAEMEAAMAMLG